VLRIAGPAEFVVEALQARGHEIRTPEDDSTAVLPPVHAQRYLGFLESAWAQWLALDPAHGERQPFPSVWPVRSLRSDVEPVNFTARLGLYSMDNGSPLSPGTWAAAKAGADAATSAAELLRRGRRAPSARPGPRATMPAPTSWAATASSTTRAVAAQALLNRGCGRVAILDVDYHHGNGTQSIFYERPEVLFVSIHGDPRTEYPFYLGHADEAGAGAGAGFNLNLPLAAGASTAAWFDALEVACTRIARHRPEALVVSLGLDTFADDPISTFQLQGADFSRLVRRLRQLGCPTLFVLEGRLCGERAGPQRRKRGRWIRAGLNRTAPIGASPTRTRSGEQPKRRPTCGRRDHPAQNASAIGRGCFRTVPAREEPCDLGLGRLECSGSRRCSSAWRPDRAPSRPRAPASPHCPSRRRARSGACSRRCDRTAV
jgi:acetoin utilization deacetylase AcuC-like enzyme